MRASSYIGDPQETLREIAFQMEMDSNGMEGDCDTARATATVTANYDLNDDVFEKGSNLAPMKKDRLLFGRSLSQGSQARSFSF